MNIIASVPILPDIAEYTWGDVVTFGGIYIPLDQPDTRLVTVMPGANGVILLIDKEKLQCVRDRSIWVHKRFRVSNEVIEINFLDS